MKHAVRAAAAEALMTDLLPVLDNSALGHCCRRRRAERTLSAKV